MGRRRWRVGLSTVSVSVILATAGCSGEDLLRQPVSGYVYLDGKPLSLGAVIFYPAKGSNLEISINGGAMIKDGYFSIPRSSGLIPGTYNVSLRAAETRPGGHHNREGHEDDEIVAREVIPERYNTKTEVRIEIKDNAIKELTFHLDSH